MKLIQQNLEQEKATDVALTELAASTVNVAAESKVKSTGHKRSYAA